MNYYLEKIGRQRIIRLVKFFLVGGSVTLAGIIGLYLLVDVLSIQPNIAYFVLTAFSLQLNFLLSYFITWSEELKQGGLARKWVKFHVSRGIVAGISQIIFAILTIIGIHYMVANLVNIVLATFVNFLVGEFLIFRSRSSR